MVGWPTSVGIDPEAAPHIPWALSKSLAITMLNAKECPSGKMPVIIGNGFGGVIFHEACGHSLEASAVSKNLSVFSNKLGTKIASDILKELLNIIY